MTNTIVDICIPMHNAYDYTLRCINSFAGNRKNDGKIRFVVHDDASDAAIGEKILNLAISSAHPFTLLRSNRQCWFTTSVNRCLSHVRSEWVLVVNSDVEMRDSEWLEKLIKAHSSFQNAGLIGCPDSLSGPGAYETDGKVQGHIWFFKRKNLEVVGLLDESNPDNIHIRSDDEWSARWRASGFKTVISCDIDHVHGGDSHPGGGASWGRNLSIMPTRLEHVAEARSAPASILVDK